MNLKRRKYTPEFRQQVIKEAMETNNCTLVARNHELSPSRVAKWVREYKSPAPHGMTLNKETKEMIKENIMLKRLLAEKELENSILQDLLKNDKTIAIKYAVAKYWISQGHRSRFVLQVVGLSSSTYYH